MNQFTIDLSRLEKLRHHGNKIIARCPACHAAGIDRKGNHFYLNTVTGQFGCAVNPGESGTGHRQEIKRLIGSEGEREYDPERDRLWKLKRRVARKRKSEETRLVQSARSKRQAIISLHTWLPEDVWEDSPQKIDCPLVEYDPGHFLASLFPAEAILWTGECFETGQNGKHADRWRTCNQWSSASKSEKVGPMVTPSTWKPGTDSRVVTGIDTSPYVVLDFDGFDGIKPVTPEELEAHIQASLSIIRCMRERLHWQLAAILWTGGKSLHAWFRSPTREIMDTLSVTAEALGIDPGLIGHPEHPCRLPGHRHAKTNNLSRILWLQLPRP